jgi:hypothetical protein
VVNRHPHHGNDWPYSRKVIRHMMGHVPVDERDKIVAANAVRTQQADPLRLLYRVYRAIPG